MHEIDVGFFFFVNFNIYPAIHVCINWEHLYKAFFIKGIHFVKAKRFDCMSSSKSCFELLKSHDKRSLLIEVEFYESVPQLQFRKLTAKIKISSKMYEIEKGKLR